MHFSLADILGTLVPYLPSALVSPCALSRVQTTARWVPAALTDRIYWETRLGPGETAVDLSLDTSTAGCEILAGRNPVITLPEPLGRHDAWTRIQALYRTVAEPSTLLGKYARQILLEFDVATGPDSPPVPGVFVGLKPLDALGPATRDRASQTQRYTGFIHSVLHCLHAGPLSQRVQDQLYACCAALPEGAVLSYIGYMLARPHRAIRLCITRLSLDALFDYLGEIGWPGAEKESRATLAGLADTGITLMMHVDVWDTVKPRLGIEFLFARRPQQAGRLDEEAWLDQLVDKDLCTPAKREALLTWPGHAGVQCPHVFWPSVLSRRVNHVKVVYGPEGVAAKAYLFAEFKAAFAL